MLPKRPVDKECLKGLRSNNHPKGYSEYGVVAHLRPFFFEPVGRRFLLACLRFVRTLALAILRRFFSSGVVARAPG
jgi:hypothetical protein